MARGVFTSRFLVNVNAGGNCPWTQAGAVEAGKEIADVVDGNSNASEREAIGMTRSKRPAVEE